MIPCQKCRRPFSDPRSLFTHLIADHGLPPEAARAGSGWYEAKQPTGDGMDTLKAPDHVAAAARARINNNPPLSVPMVQVEKKKQIQLPAGWIKATDSYIYDIVIAEEHTIDNITKRILKGKVTENNGRLDLFTYSKNTSELAELQEKERILTSRLDSFVPADSSFFHIVSQLHEIKPKIKAMKRDMQAEINCELILEDYYRGTLRTDAHTEWLEQFMKKCLEETQRVKEIVKKSDPIPIKEQKQEDTT